jgi:hypothetical protein
MRFLLSAVAKTAPATARERCAGAADVNMPEVTTAPLIDSESAAQQAGATRRGTDKQAAAHRLRALGFSYRRIAETLRIRYDIVSRWMYGEPPPSAVAAPIPTPAPVAALPETAPVTPGLEQRLAALEAALSRFQAEAAQREERLLAELSALRLALEASAGQAAGHARVLPWPRIEERG